MVDDCSSLTMGLSSAETEKFTIHAYCICGIYEALWRSVKLECSLKRQCREIFYPKKKTTRAPYEQAETCSQFFLHFAKISYIYLFNLQLLTNFHNIYKNSQAVSSPVLFIDPPLTLYSKPFTMCTFSLRGKTNHSAADCVCLGQPIKVWSHPPFTSL